MQRRTFLSAGMVGVAGVSGFLAGDALDLLEGGSDESSGNDSGSATTIVDNGASTPERTLTIELTVLDRSGDPIGDEAVVLKDRGGTPDDRYATTGANGKIVFLEGVGPPPCNRQTIVFPDRDRQVTLGCNDGGKTITRTVEIGDEDAPAESRRNYDPATTIVDNSGSTPGRTLTVEVSVVDPTGGPLADESVLLKDRGGTPDDRYATTGLNGKIVFLEGVGPPPCNRQTVVLPRWDRRESLGCNDGGKTITTELTVEPA